MQQDLLDGSTPRRLVLRKGQWILEVERLVAVDSSVYRPKLHRMFGGATILDYLQQNAHHTALPQRAAELMRHFEGEQEGTFNAVEGDWAPAAVPAPSAGPRAEPGGGRQQALEVLELKSTLRQLRGSHDRLRFRVGELERRLASLMTLVERGGLPAAAAAPVPTGAVAPTGAAAPMAPMAPMGQAPPGTAGRAALEAGATMAAAPAGASAPGTPAPNGVRPGPDAALGTDATVVGAAPPAPGDAAGAGPTREATSVNPEGPVAAAAQALTEDGGDGDSTPPVLGDEGAPEAAADAAPEAAEPYPIKPLKWPVEKAVVNCLTDLIGEEILLDEVPSEPESLEELAAGHYAARLLDDDGEEIGLVIADVAATIQLGGRLLMLPGPEIDSQAKAGEPSEDTVEALSEVFNMLTAPLNNVKRNPHLRSEPAQALRDLSVAWMASARGRQDYKVSLGGRLYFVAR